jgi:diguanylate cyclase (GGDEF)-like protein/PAS domain S-box-containing protein
MQPDQGAKNTTKRTMPIRTLIIIVYAVSALIGILSAGAVIFSNWKSSIDSTVMEMANETNRDIIEEIETYIQVPKHMVEVNLGLLEQGIIDMENPVLREKFFVNALGSHEGESVYSFSFGSVSGDYYGARRSEEGAIQIMRNNASTEGHSWYYAVNDDLTAGDLIVEAGKFDARTRAWYKAAVESGDLAYSSIYKHFVLNDLTISAAAPLYDRAGKLQGVLGAHTTLESTNAAMREITGRKNALSVIVEKDTGFLVANGLGKNNYTLDAEGKFQRLSIKDFGNPLMLQAYEGFMGSGETSLIIDQESERHFTEIAEFKQSGIRWLVITSVPEGVLAAGYQKSFEASILLGLLILLLFVLFFLKLSRKLFGPITSLLETQERFSAGDLTQRASIVRNDEVGKLAASFNRMAEVIDSHVHQLEDEVKARTEDLRDRNEALEDHKDRLKLILDSTVEAICGLDTLGRCTFINDSGVHMLGYDSASEIVGRHLHKAIHHSMRDGKPILDEECKIYQASTKGVGAHVSDEVFWRKDGSCFDVEYHSYPQILDDKVVGTVVTFMDNTERKKMQQMIYNEKEQFKTTLLSVGDGVISTDHHGRVQVMNPIAEALTGWTQEEAFGKPFEEVFHIINEFTRERCENPVERVLEIGEIIELANHTILIGKDGKEIAIEDSAAPIRSNNGFITGVVIVFRDFTDKKERIQEIEYLSFHDHLTGLYNRRYIEDALARIDTERNLPFSFMTIDVNGLKLTNDAFGHKMGDRLLVQVSQLLKSVCREDDLIGRMGGDEFAILLPKTSELQVEGIKRRIMEAAGKVKLDSVIVSVAIGHATKNEIDKEMSEILTLADNNMYKEKLKFGKLMRSQTIETVLKNINLKYDQEQIHTERVSQYCEAIARAMALSEKDVQDIKTAGVLHDIGKIMILPELLNKPGRLTEEEFEIIKRHPETSYQILKSVDEYASVAEDVLYHHERMDGKGYPEGLTGDQIPLNARIIAVADAFEAMTAKRPYHKPKTKEEAMAELKRCAGTQFDPRVVEVFVGRVL